VKDSTLKLLYETLTPLTCLWMIASNKVAELPPADKVASLLARINVELRDEEERRRTA